VAEAVLHPSGGPTLPSHTPQAAVDYGLGRSGGSWGPGRDYGYTLMAGWRTLWVSPDELTHIEHQKEQPFVQSRPVTA
jgi:hypothetical protein